LVLGCGGCYPVPVQLMPNTSLNPVPQTAVLFARRLTV
jgi:hypothetical protein